MREKSQIEDMRAALRGDIERARARREADPWRAQEATEPEPVTDIEELAASGGKTPEGSVPAETIDEPEAVEVAEPVEPEPEPVTDIEELAASGGKTPEGSVPAETIDEPEAERPGFFARLFGRG